MIDRAYETDEAFDPGRQKQSWERFAHYLNHLNKAGNGKTKYKLLYAARHGEGYHNVQERKVGTAAWEVSICLYSFLLFVRRRANLQHQSNIYPLNSLIGRSWTATARSSGRTLT